MGQIGYLFNLIFTYPIFNVLMVLYHLFGDFGLSIIVLTLIIKLILFPLTLAQLKSMRATQALQPHIAELRRKHGKDQQALALATQDLYKEFGINPVAGCLPLFIQLPVLYGLYFALSQVVRATTHQVSAINSVLYPFVPHFITYPNINLNWFTFINPAFHISLGSPDPTHILPIIAGLATFIQLRMSQPKTAAVPSGASDPTAQSMKMMQYIMPIFTVFIGWTFPAGLALYWTISSVFQAIQQFFVTGWGSLLVTPNLNLGGNGGSASNGKRPNNGNGGGGKGNYAVALSNDQERVQEQADDDEATEGDSPVSQRTASHNGAATARRRSASARRRSSNNTQRKNVSSR